MGAFPKRKFRGAADGSSFAVRYRALMQKRPFLLFGLPFMAVIIGGSFILTPATAIRYERQDRRVRQVSREEELGMGKNKRRVDVKEEYYRLAAKDIDNWEQRRVERLPGERDGVLE